MAQCCAAGSTADISVLIAYASYSLPCYEGHYSALLVLEATAEAAEVSTLLSQLRTIVTKEIRCCVTSWIYVSRQLLIIRGKNPNFEA